MITLANLTSRQIAAKVTADTKGRVAPETEMHDALCGKLQEAQVAENQLRGAIKTAQRTLVALTEMLDCDGTTNNLGELQGQGDRVDVLTATLGAHCSAYATFVEMALMIAAS